jgi:hypothetical protein
MRTAQEIARVFRTNSTSMVTDLERRKPTDGSLETLTGTRSLLGNVTMTLKSGPDGPNGLKTRLRICVVTGDQARNLNSHGSDQSEEVQE